MKPCVQCATDFEPKRRDARFCSPRCRRNAHRDRDEPCTESGCQRPQRARGLCNADWKRKYGKPTRYLITCEACGIEHRSARPDGKYCTDWCKGWAYAEKTGSNVRTIPDTHPILSSPVPADHPSRWPYLNLAYRFYIPDCRWCGTAFVTQQPLQILCSRRCARREAKAKRKALAHGAGGTYTWTEVVALFLKFNRCCAYCRLPTEGQPDPDHVIPLSRGGANSITNILPACRACNSDKRDLLLHEWAPDRAHRGLPEVTTSWVRGDPLYMHLSILQAHECAA